MRRPARLGRAASMQNTLSRRCPKEPHAQGSCELAPSAVTARSTAGGIGHQKCVVDRVSPATSGSSTSTRERGVGRAARRLPLALARFHSPPPGSHSPFPTGRLGFFPFQNATPLYTRATRPTRKLAERTGRQGRQLARASAWAHGGATP